MTNLRDELQSFEDFLDSLIGKRQDMIVDVKTISKVSKLAKLLQSQTAAGAHTLKNQNKIVSVPWSSSSIEPKSTVQQKVKFYGQAKGSDLVSCAEKLFEELKVVNSLVRPSQKTRTRFWLCCKTSLTSLPRLMSSCASSRVCSSASARWPCTVITSC